MKHECNAYMCGSAVGWGTALQAGRSRVRFPMVSLEFFYWINPSGRTMALGSTQPLTEISARNISWGVKGWQPYHLQVPIVLKSGSLNLLERSGPVQACNGIDLPLPFTVYMVVCGCETWVLKENIIQKLSVFERKILRKVFGPTKRKMEAGKSKRI